jgi:hypothetical protein
LPLIKYYADRIGTSDLASYPLESRGSAAVKTGRSKIRSTNKSQGWQDRDSLDNSSQNTILRQQQVSSQDYILDDSLQYKIGKIPNQGILTTTEVEIHTSDATDVEVEREAQKKKGGKW